MVGGVEAGTATVGEVGAGSAMLGAMVGVGRGADVIGTARRADVVVCTGGSVTVLGLGAVKGEVAVIRRAGVGRCTGWVLLCCCGGWQQGPIKELLWSLEWRRPEQRRWHQLLHP